MSSAVQDAKRVESSLWRMWSIGPCVDAASMRKSQFLSGSCTIKSGNFPCKSNWTPSEASRCCSKSMSLHLRLRHRGLLRQE